MRTTLTILTILLTATFIFGQKYSVGAEVGIVSSINTDYRASNIKNRRNTYYSGINLNYQLNRRISISSGLHYLRQGYHHPICTIYDEGVRNKLVGKIDYLAIPLTANIHLLNSRKLITTLGLLGAFNIKAVQDYPEPPDGCEAYYIPDLKDLTRKYSISGIIGIGYKLFENENINLITNIKYYQGLTNTYDNPNQELSYFSARKYSSALLTFNFNFKL